MEDLQSRMEEFSNSKNDLDLQSTKGESQKKLFESSDSTPKNSEKSSSFKKLQTNKKVLVVDDLSG